MIYKKVLSFLMMMTMTFFVLSCGKNSMQITETAGTNLGNGASLSGETVGFDKAKVVFENKCFMCHNGNVHPKNWTIYETAKANLNNIYNRVFVLGNMPAAGSLTSSEKSILRAWIDGGGAEFSTSATATGTASSPAPSTDPTSTPAPSPAPVSTDPGEALFLNKCLGCHGTGAISLNTPLLHGQQKNYLTKQLNDFKSGLRKDLLMGAMNGVASGLSDSEINNVTTYLSSQSQCSVEINIESLGGDIYEGEKKADRCTKCHSEFAPILRGQKTGYLKMTLFNFKNNKRFNSTMNNEARELNDFEINNIAAYFNSKRSCK